MEIDIAKYGTHLTTIKEDGCPEIHAFFDKKTDTLYCLSAHPTLHFEIGFTGDGTIIYDDGSYANDPRTAKCLSEKIHFHYNDDDSDPVAMSFSFRKENCSFHYETLLRNIEIPIKDDVYISSELHLAKVMIKRWFPHRLRTE